MTDQAGDKSAGTNKNLKQARLPFKVLDIKSAVQNNVPKKRKLSVEDVSKEAKIVKKTNTENNVNSVNTDTTSAQQCVDTENQGSEIVKPLFKFERKNSDNDDVLLVETLVSVNGGTTVKSDKPESSTEGLDNKDKKLHSETNCETSNSASEDADVENKDCSLELLDSTAVSIVSENEDASDAEGDSLILSSLETDGPSLNISTCTMETEGDGKTAESELDKSIQLSTAPESENKSSTPAAEKAEESIKRPGRRKSLEVQKHKEEKARLRAEKEKKLQEAREAKKREKEREKERKEVERNMAKQKKKQELEEKLKERQAKQAQKEAENKEKLKALEERKAKKMEFLQAKIDEKKRKEEEKQRRKEEKQKEEEEKQRKLEEKKKLDSEVSAKSKAVFASFFIKGSSTPQQAPAEEPCGLFKPFEVMKNMVVASITPQDIMTQFDKENLDGCFNKQDTCRLYLEELKLGSRTPYKRRKPLPKVDEADDDVLIVEDSKSKSSPHHAKLYQFSENVRPPYYGTWRKTSKMVTGRRPFALDTVTFDYEVDSEEEWDEGGPGESLSGTEEEKESEDDYEVDNEFFVPHGYLSADEEKDEDVGVGTAEHQARLKMREQIFQEERKRKFSELKPRITGCVWTSVDGSSVHIGEEELARVLNPYIAILLCSIPISMSSPQKRPSPSNENKDSTGESSARQNTKKIPEEAIPHLIKLVHGNTNGMALIQKEFMHYWTLHRRNAGIIPSEEENVVKEKDVSSPMSGTPERRTEESPSSFVYNTGFSKSQLKLTLNKISVYGRCPDPNYPRCVWWVHEEVRTKYGCVDLPVPNKWAYVSRNNVESKRRKKALVLESDVPEKVPAADLETPTKGGNSDNPNSILKFTCKMSPSERFEANLQAVSNKNETKDSVPTNRSNSLLKFAFKSSLGDSNRSKTENDCSKTDHKSVKNGSGNETVQDSNHKVQKETCSILKFTRKITPVRIGSSALSKNEEKTEPNNVKAPEVVLLD